MAFGPGHAGVVYLNGYDLTTYFHNVQMVNSQGTYDTTTLGGSSKSFINGLADGQVTLDGFFDSGSASAEDPVLDAAMRATSDGVLLVFPAGDALGARGRGCASISTNYQTTVPVDGVVGIATAVQADGGLDPVVSLHPLSVETAAFTSGTQVDNGASTANGLAGYIECTSFTGTSVTGIIQHSADGGGGGTWVDLVTFTAISAANAKERKTAAGTVNRYLRAKGTGTFNPATLVIAAARL